MCVPGEWRLGQLVFVNISVAFGALHPPTYLHLGSSDAPHVPRPLRRGTTDLLAFLIILFTARRSGMNRYPGVPNLLDTILRDATGYFLSMFSFQFLYQLLFITNRVRGPRYAIRVVNRVALIVGVCSDPTPSISRAVSLLSRCRRDLWTIDVNWCLTGREWFSFRSWHHASCFL